MNNNTKQLKYLNFTFVYCFRRNEWNGIAWPNSLAKERGYKKVEIKSDNEKDMILSFKKIALSEKYNDQKKIEEILSSKHKEYLMLIDKPFVGTIKAKHRSTTHCYACKTVINDNIEDTCILCKWRVCPNCGACGCGYVG